MPERESREAWASFFWTAFRRSGNPMAVAAADRILLAVNAAFTTLSGYRPEDLVGQPIDRLAADGDADLLERDWADLPAEGHTVRERLLVRADGGHERVQFAAESEVVTGRRLVLLVMLNRRAAWLSPASGAPASGSLTPRELEVVGEIAMGRRAHEIADLLHIAPSTVQTHARNAMAKLGARSQAQLVGLATARGLLDPKLLNHHI